MRGLLDFDDFSIYPYWSTISLVCEHTLISRILYSTLSLPVDVATQSRLSERESAYTSYNLQQQASSDVVKFKTVPCKGGTTSALLNKHQLAWLMFKTVPGYGGSTSTLLHKYKLVWSAH